MAARASRPRSGPGNQDRDDAHEERTMWEQINRDLRKCKAINDRAKEVGKLILEKEEKMAKRKYTTCSRVPNPTSRSIPTMRILVSLLLLVEAGKLWRKHIMSTR